MIQSELKRFMLLMAVALFIGAISFSAGIAQEEAKGGAEAAAAAPAAAAGPAIAQAVYNAIGMWVDMPMTPENVITALQNDS